MPNHALELALDTVSIGKQALVFVNTKAGAEKLAEDIAGKIRSADQGLLQLSSLARKSLARPTRQCERLALCLKKGIAFHHAGLTQEQRALVEDGFRAAQIRIICCTPSLAMGVDLPAFRSIIRDVKRYGRGGLEFIPVLEYMQMAGRAGRPKFDTHGEAVLVSGTVHGDELTERYINGRPEDIYSKLAVEPVLRTYTLSLIASGFVRTRSEILDFFRSTFWAHQYHDMDALMAKIGRMLSLLVEYNFIVSSEQEFSGADELGSVRYRATMLGRRVAQLYLDPLSAHGFLHAMLHAEKVRTTPFSYMQLISSTLEMRPLLRVRQKEYDSVIQTLAQNEDSLITAEPSAFEPGYDEFLDSVKTAMFFLDWADEEDEESLLAGYNIRPGEIRAKLDVADWLAYSLGEIARLSGYRRQEAEIAKLRLRLRYGVREELLGLVRLRQIGRVRARSLFTNRIRSLSDVRRASPATLAQILGRKVADNVREQLGITQKKHKKGARRGQKGLI